MHIKAHVCVFEHEFYLCFCAYAHVQKFLLCKFDCLEVYQKLNYNVNLNHSNFDSRFVK